MEYWVWYADDVFILISDQLKLDRIPTSPCNPER